MARLARVSRKTVSRVVNKSPAVRTDTRARVEAVIERFGYAPDPQRQRLAFRRSFLIGLIYHNPNPQSVIDMQQGYCVLSIPARHDVARRGDCAFLARLVTEHRLEEDEAAEVAVELGNLPRTRL